MDYTLDSVEQFCKALKELRKAKDISRIPVVIDDLTELKASNNRLYFGILTVGSNVVKTILKNENDVEIVTVLSNSQIADYFYSASFLDGANANLVNPFGHFRGFEVYIS